MTPFGRVTPFGRADYDLPTPFLRMPFVDAMNRFGVDKPDLRFGLELPGPVSICPEGGGSSRFPVP